MNKLSIDLLFADFWTINSRKTNCSLSSLCDQEKALCLIVILKLTRWCLQENCKDKTPNVLLAEQPKENESIGSLPATDVYASAFCAFDVVLPMQNDTQVHNGIRYSWFTFPWPSKTRTCTIHFFQSFKCTGSTFLPRARFSIKNKQMCGIRIPFVPWILCGYEKNTWNFSVSPSHLDGVTWTSSRIPGVVGGR